MPPCRHAPIGILLAFAASSLGAAQATGIPNMSCQGPYSASWDNCVGTVTDQHGFFYGGEFHHGLREGFGFLMFKGVSDRDILSNRLKAHTPSKDSSDRSSVQALPEVTVSAHRKREAFYAGQFRADKLNGHGVLWLSDGGYSVTYLDDNLQSVTKRTCTLPTRAICLGELRYPNGNIYFGEYYEGHRDGVGLLNIRDRGTSSLGEIRASTQGIYVGEFRGDLENGQGMTLGPGWGYYGAFEDDIFKGSSATATSEHNQ